MAIFDNFKVPFPDVNPVNLFSEALPDLVELPSDFKTNTTKGNEFIEEFGYVPIPANANDNLLARLGNIYNAAVRVFNFIGLPFPKVISSGFAKLGNYNSYFEDPKGALIKFAPMGIAAATPYLKDKFNKIKKKFRPGGKGGETEGPTNVKLEPLDDSSSINAERTKVKKVENGPGSGDMKLYSFKGRESLVGLTIGSDDLWDISFTPYKLSRNSPTFAPDPEAYFGPNERGANGKTVTKNSGQAGYIPVLSFSLDYRQQKSAEIELFGGSSINIPDIYVKSNRLSMEISEDENNRWTKYFNTYLDNLYDPVTNSVKPYKNSCLLFTIYTYRPDKQLLSEMKLIGVLHNFRTDKQGTGSPSAKTLEVEFSIVGEIEDPRMPKY